MTNHYHSLRLPFFSNYLPTMCLSCHHTVSIIFLVYLCATLSSRSHECPDKHLCVPLLSQYSCYSLVRIRSKYPPVTACSLHTHPYPRTNELYSSGYTPSQIAKYAIRFTQFVLPSPMPLTLSRMPRKTCI